MRFDALHDWLAWQEQIQPVFELKLQRIAKVAQQLAILPLNPIVITIAGTNGKGSTLAIIESILLAAGYRVGCYTSPHIEHYNERIRVNQQPASDQTICNAFAEIDAICADQPLSYFEFGTLAALLIFKQQPLDVILLEVGLGGRLDAVNIVPPNIAVITTISIDHTAYLGDTREKIGYEKAGIMRANIPVICGDPNPPQSLINHAKQLNVQLWRYQQDFFTQQQNTTWQWCQQTQSLTLPYPNLAGSHQLQNACIALMALHCLPQPLPSMAYATGLRNIQHKARFQIVYHQGFEHIIDVAHNPESAQALATTLQDTAKSGKLYALFSALADKDINQIIEPLKSLVTSWYIAPLQNTPRTLDSQALNSLFQQQQLSYQAYTTLTDAYKNCLAQLQAGDQLLVFGSFYTVAECLPLIQTTDCKS